MDKFVWEDDDIEVIEDKPNKQKALVEAARLLSLIHRAGARHSRIDNNAIQKIHDMACELGAVCPDKRAEEHNKRAENFLRQYVK